MLAFGKRDFMPEYKLEGIQGPVGLSNELSK